MAKTEKSAYLVIVFPEPTSPLGPLANDVLQALTTCCGQAPTLVYPDKKKLVMLANGEHTAIIKALQAACQQNNDPWLLAQVGMPCVANGLARAEGWIRSHLLAPQK